MIHAKAHKRTCAIQLFFLKAQFLNLSQSETIQPPRISFLFNHFTVSVYLNRIFGWTCWRKTVHQSISRLLPCWSDRQISSNQHLWVSVDNKQTGLNAVSPLPTCVNTTCISCWNQKKSFLREKMKLCQAQSGSQSPHQPVQEMLPVLWAKMQPTLLRDLQVCFWCECFALS